MKTLAKTARDVGVSALGFSAVLALALAFGGPSAPPAHAELRAAFDKADLSGAPETKIFTARDGAQLAFRRYGDEGRIAVLLHGSGGAGASLHRLAVALAEAGRQVIVPDIRGHGASGARGDMDYIGQAEDDIDDLLDHLAASEGAGPRDFVGFSIGGGLALRYAANRGATIDRLILISPYLAHDAPPTTVAAKAEDYVVWAEAGVPRIVALAALNSVGVTALNGLEVIRLAVDPRDEGVLTPGYSYRLMTSVNPANWRADLAATADKLTIVASDADELHALAGFREALDEYAPEARLIAAAGASHIELILSDAAIATVVEAVESGK